MSDDELLKKYNALYLEIIMRYREKIEEGERLYMAELPKLVTPDDESVRAAVNKIKGEFLSYNLEENFSEAMQKAYDFVSGSVSQVSPPIQFWLRPGQVLNIGAGDIFDQAVLLCSMLIGLGNLSSKVIVAVKGEDEKNYAVYCEYKGKLLEAELGKGLSELKDKQEMLAKIGVFMGSETTAYEFNDKMYNSIA